MTRMGVVVKKRKEGAGTLEAPPLTAAVAAPAQVEEAASHPLATVQVPQGVVVQPREEPAPTGHQAAAPSIPVVPEGGSEPPVPQAVLATASLAMTPADTPVPPPPQALALADCGPLIWPGALDEAYAALGQL